jgi:hypothetical protein
LPRWHPLSGSPSRAIPLLLRARPDAGEGTCRCFCRERQDLGKPHGTPSQAVARHLLPTMRRSRHQQDIGASQTVVLSGLWARILLPPNENARHRGEESAVEVAAGAPGLLLAKGASRRLRSWRQRRPATPSTSGATSSSRSGCEAKLPFEETRDLRARLAEASRGALRCRHGARDSPEAKNPARVQGTQSGPGLRTRRQSVWPGVLPRRPYARRLR